MERNEQMPVLPASVVTPADVARLQREVESVADFLEQAQIRQPGTSVTPPRLSKMLEEVAGLNKINLLEAHDRDQMIKFFMELKEHAPRVHMSFAAEPTGAFMSKIVAWFRKEVHPFILVQIGLQPNMAVGCVVRTTNKYFDFNLQKHLAKSKGTLVEILKGSA